MKDSNKYRYWILSGFIVGVLVVFIYVTIKYNNVLYDSRDIDVDFYDRSSIKVSNLLTVTDAVGKKISNKNIKSDSQGLVEFSIKSNVRGNIYYEIYLVRKDYEEDNVPEKFVKLYLTDDNDKVVNDDKGLTLPTYYDLRVADSNPGGRVIYSGILKGNATEKFKLRAWVTDTYEITKNPKEFSFDICVDVK